MCGPRQIFIDWDAESWWDSEDPKDWTVHGLKHLKIASRWLASKKHTKTSCKFTSRLCVPTISTVFCDIGSCNSYQQVYYSHVIPCHRSVTRIDLVEERANGIFSSGQWNTLHWFTTLPERHWIVVQGITRLLLFPWLRSLFKDFVQSLYSTLFKVFIQL